METRIRIWAGKYVAGATGVVLSLVRGSQQIDIREISPGEEFEVQETINGFRYVVLWHEDEGLPRPVFTRIS